MPTDFYVFYMNYIVPFWLSNIYFLIFAIAGFMLGEYIDKTYDTSPWGMIISVAISFVIAVTLFLTVIKKYILLMIEKYGPKR